MNDECFENHTGKQTKARIIKFAVVIAIKVAKEQEKNTIRW